MIEIIHAQIEISKNLNINSGKGKELKNNEYKV